jgi:hypothetical protein
MLSRSSNNGVVIGILHPDEGRKLPQTSYPESQLARERAADKTCLRHTWRLGEGCERCLSLPHSLQTEGN